MKETEIDSTDGEGGRHRGNSNVKTEHREKQLQVR